MNVDSAGRRPSESALPPRDRLVLLLLVLVPVVWNAITLWPEVSRPVPNLNDSAVHYLVVQRANEALTNGENVVDHWLPQTEIGFPMFRYYQQLPQLFVVFLHRMLFAQVDLYTLFNVVRYLIMITFPFVVWWSMRTMTTENSSTARSSRTTRGTARKTTSTRSS